MVGSRLRHLKKGDRGGPPVRFVVALILVSMSITILLSRRKGGAMNMLEFLAKSSYL